jgi:hypothetical protein
MIPRGLTIDDEVKVMKQWEARLAASGQMPIKPVKDKVELPDIKSERKEKESEVEVPKPAIALPFNPGGKPVIDCSVDPVKPDGCDIKPEDQIIGRVTGQFVWDPSKIDFHVTAIQKKSNFTPGFKVKKRLAGMPVLPANVWDWLKEDPQNRVPKSWDNIKGCLMFWGHVFSDWHNVQCVRRMRYDHGWEFSSIDIRGGFTRYDFALCLM